MKVLAVVGVRPNIMKFAAWIKAISEYSESISHISNSTFVLTDSGGLQEETSILGSPMFDNAK